MRCVEIMSRKVETVPPDLPAEEAWTRMRLRGIHHLVVMEGNAITGILSTRDLGGPRGAAVRKDATVGDLMTPRPVTVEPDTTIKRAANVMRGHSVGCLPVVRGGKVKGIVTVSDLLDLIGRGIERAEPAEKRRKGPKPGGRRGPPTAWVRPQNAVRTRCR